MYFAKDSSGNWGYKVGGADPVIPFSKNSEIRSALPVGKEVSVNYPANTIGRGKLNDVERYDSSYIINKGPSNFTVTYNNGNIVYLIESKTKSTYSFSGDPRNQVTQYGYFDASTIVDGKQYFGWVSFPFDRYIELFTTVENRKREYNYPLSGSSFYKSDKYGNALPDYVLTDGSIFTTTDRNNSIQCRCYYSMLILVS